MELLEYFKTVDGIAHENIVSPSILSADFANLAAEIKKTEKFGAAWCHVDVMDGHFVPNITIGAPVVKSLKKAVNAKLDVHLMIENPLKYIPDFIEAGSDIITFHIEASKISLKCDTTFDCIKMIKEAGLLAGISIKPKTPAEVVKKYLPFVDMILIMTVEPGFSGQKFMPEAAFKVKEIRDFLLDEISKMPESLSEILNFPVAKNPIIQVDGGINDETYKICKKFGANCFVAGNYVYKNSDMKKAVESLLG